MIFWFPKHFCCWPDSDSLGTKVRNILLLNTEGSHITEFWGRSGWSARRSDVWGKRTGDQSGRSSQPVRMPLLSLPAVLLASLALATALPDPGLRPGTQSILTDWCITWLIINLVNFIILCSLSVESQQELKIWAWNNLLSQLYKTRRPLAAAL